jgi:hypothetical protein
MGIRDFFIRTRPEKEVLWQVTCLQLDGITDPIVIAQKVRTALEHFDVICGKIQSIDTQPMNVGGRDFILLICAYTE